MFWKSKWKNSFRIQTRNTKMEIVREEKEASGRPSLQALRVPGGGKSNSGIFFPLELKKTACTWRLKEHISSPERLGRQEEGSTCPDICRWTFCKLEKEENFISYQKKLLVAEKTILLVPDFLSKATEKKLREKKFYLSKANFGLGSCFFKPEYLSSGPWCAGSFLST